jgi:hypothetical protein
MKRAGLSAHDRALLEEVRELLRALAAHLSLDLDDRFGRLEQLVRERRTVIVRRPKKTGARPAGAIAENASSAPSHATDTGGPSPAGGVAHPSPTRTRL